MVTKVLTNYARVLMFLEDLVSLPEDCGQNSVGWARFLYFGGQSFSTVLPAV